MSRISRPRLIRETVVSGVGDFAQYPQRIGKSFLLKTFHLGKVFQISFVKSSRATVFVISIICGSMDVSLSIVCSKKAIYISPRVIRDPGNLNRSSELWASFIR